MNDTVSAPRVFVVDDDPAVRDALAMLLEAEGFVPQAFESAVQFLRSYDPRWPGCLILDVRMPAMSGLELQRELSRRGIAIPIIFLTGHGDVPMASEAFRSGAVDFIEKPFRDDELIERIGDAIARDREARQRRGLAGQVRQRYSRLTPREREVMKLVVEGKSNKEIARILDVSHRTIDVHRARVMDKMGVRSLPELVNNAVLCGLY